ncbi:hypothetical protein [Rhodopirellula europaea]|uniref:hypothetical protein n=1 Tax=Rhodopirellula europaea TaxID=1263866 RepID=UPI00056A1A4C|nr:hypothetical protein [Rhodopirellula europaea]
MKPTNDSRILLLEQLESRSLLAGGIFTHSDMGANQGIDRSQIDRAVPTLQRTAAQINSGGGRDGARAQNLRAQNLSERAHDPGAARPMRDFAAIARPSQQHGQHDGGQHDRGQQLSGREPRSSELRASDLISQSSQSSSQTSVGGSSNNQSVRSSDSSSVLWVVQFVVDSPRPSNSVSVGDVLDGLSGGNDRSPTGEGTVLARANSAAGSSESGSPGRSSDSKATVSNAATNNNGSVQGNGSAVASVDDSPATVANANAAERTSGSGDSSQVATDDSSSRIAGEADGGTIDWLPRVSRSDVSLEASQSDDDAWELDERTLEQLRKVARDATDGLTEDVESGRVPDTSETPVLQGNSVDDALASWFGSPTGLIDGIRFQDALPTVVPTFSPGMVDIALDATVGVHRTIGLMASSEAVPTPVVVNEVRDAVLAAIAFETDALAQPALDTRPLRLSGFAYPGVAIVAGTLALNARRRRSGVLLTSR